jgi:hypothetical protein
MGVPRLDADVLAYLALRITFATAQACEGAPAGPRRGLDCLLPTHGGCGEGRFVPLDPGKRQPLTRVRPLRVPIAIGTSVASRLPFVCGGNVCVGESRTVGILANHRHALAHRAGTDYESLLRTRILAPLGLTGTAVTLSSALRTSGRWSRYAVAADYMG